MDTRALSVNTAVSVSHDVATSEAVRSEAAKGLVLPVPWLLERNVFKPGASQFVAGTSVTDGFTPAYLAAHALKIVGAAIGGWLAGRKLRAA